MLLGIGVFVATLVVWSLVWFLVVPSWKHRAAASLEGPERHLFWGSEVRPDTAPRWNEFYQRWMLRFGDRGAYRQWMGPMFPSVHLVAGHTAREVLRTAAPKSAFYGLLHSWLGRNSLLTGSGDEWQRRRKAFTPAFHFAPLRAYIPVYVRCTAEYLSMISDMQASGDRLELFSTFSLLTLEVICLCAFGYPLGALRRHRSAEAADTEAARYIAAVQRLTFAFMERFFDPLTLMSERWWRLKGMAKDWDAALVVVNRFVDSVVRERKQKLAAPAAAVASTAAADGGGAASRFESEFEGNRFQDFLGILLNNEETGLHFTDGEIRDELNTFAFEGHDTTASALTWTVYRILKHRNVHRRVVEEIDAVLGDRTEPTAADLDKLRYLTMVVKESLRLHPPVPSISRCLHQPVTIESVGVTLPVGTDVNISPIEIHYNPREWPYPDSFIPERFDPDDPQKVPASREFSWVPFSAGPRNCIGQQFALNEEKVVLAMLFKRFTLELEPDQSGAAAMEIINRPRDGIYIRLSPRS